MMLAFHAPPEAVTIPVMAKCRIGHFVEAEILQALGVDCIDESEVLTPADESYHVAKDRFEVPFVCGARDLGEALRRIGEGAAMIRSKGEAGTGNIVEAVRHLRSITDGIRSRSARSICTWFSSPPSHGHSAGKAWRETVNTRQPSRAKRFTVAWPMPRLAPVSSKVRR